MDIDSSVGARPRHGRWARPRPPPLWDMEYGRWARPRPLIKYRSDMTSSIPIHLELAPHPSPPSQFPFIYEGLSISMASVGLPAGIPYL